jgi:dTDP-4-dehydrorhamnose 3,5-epimerase
VTINFDIKESDIIKGLWIITPSVSDDLRGNIWTSFLKDSLEQLLPKNLAFIHDKFSISKKNVLRGIHGDYNSWKLVSCVYGEIQQVVVDLRLKSPTYKKYQQFVIGESNFQLILIPPNMGNAYLVKSLNAVYHYKLAYLGKYIDANDQYSLKWNDESIGINWSTKSPILSERDSYS